MNNACQVEKITGVSLRRDEPRVTRRTNDIVALAEEEKDCAIRTFLSWFVNEQVEEVSSAQEIAGLVQMTPKTMMRLPNGSIYRMLQ